MGGKVQHGISKERFYLEIWHIVETNQSPSKTFEFNFNYAWCAWKVAQVLHILREFTRHKTTPIREHICTQYACYVIDDALVLVPNYAGKVRRGGLSFEIVLPPGRCH